MKPVLLTTIGVVLAFQFTASAGEKGEAPAITEMKQPAAVVESVSDKPEVQTVCPVMEGGTVDRSVFAFWKGDKTYGPKKVYFCCAGCIEPFNTDPVKYIKVLEKMGQPVEDVVLKQGKKK